MAEKKRGFLLANIPDDIFQFLIQEQAKAKLKGNKVQFGIEQTIYKCLRDYMRCREENNFQE